MLTESGESVNLGLHSSASLIGLGDKVVSAQLCMLTPLSLRIEKAVI